jgi:hypothetical protein
LETMFRISMERNTLKQDAAKNVQTEYAPMDVRFHGALRQGHDLGDAVRRNYEGDNAILRNIFKDGR